MFGSEIVKTLIFQRMSALTTVTDAVGSRLWSLELLPAPDDPPALLFYPTSTGYAGAVNGPASTEEMSYEVKLVCTGTSTNPIWDAAEAQYADLASKSFQIEIRGATYMVSFTEREEIIPTTVYEGGTFYRMLGTRYDTIVTKG